MNKKKKLGQYIATAFFVLIGAACGVLIMSYIDSMFDTGNSAGEALLVLIALFVVMYITIFLHMIIHEAGHLVFGLLSGYKFSSFRIMSFMWVKEGDKIKCRRLSLAGTGGQCLMAPPELVDGKMPVVLYNMGGTIMNVIAAALLFCAALCRSRNAPSFNCVFDDGCRRRCDSGDERRAHAYGDS